MAATPDGHPDRAIVLSNLGNALHDRFKRTGNRADLDAAITLGLDAIAAARPNQPVRAAILSILGNALHTRFEQAGNRADRDAAIDAGRDAVAATPDDHPKRADYLSNFSYVLYIRCLLAGGQADLEDAVTASRHALATTPDGHPRRATMLANLGLALSTRFERTGNQADLDAAVTASRDAVAVEVAPPRGRELAARVWGHAAATGKQWQEAVVAFTAAAELLGRVAPRSITRGDQEHLLMDLGGLGADAAACCVHAGRPDRAVELFEQGRGVLLGQALDTRTDLTALAEQQPDLARRFTALRDELDWAGGATRQPTALATETAGAAGAGAARREAERRREVAEAFDRTIVEIRALPDFAGFLHPPPVGELAAAAADGPVVVVSVSQFGSHALILTSGGVLEPVPLADLTLQAIYERVAGFLDALGGVTPPGGDTGGATAERQMEGTLGWLWDALAGPVLDRLDMTGPPRDGEPWPRLWWCTSGVLSFLPLHAAGHHGTRFDPSPATVIDRVMSSYTPTVRALAHARRTRPAADAAIAGKGGRADHGDGEGIASGLGSGRVVAVAMPHTPGATDLPGAEAEVSVLRRHLGDQVTVLTGSQATRDTVIRELPAARWVHFSCHGAADLANPSASHLLLVDHQERPLTVVDIAGLRLDGAELAFLSAWSTAQPGARLADEAIHLASAFQLAGYRHVIGTLWPIGDRHAVDITDDIYTTVTATGDVAAAVHAATHRLRNRWAESPSAWASHIHVGA